VCEIHDNAIMNTKKQAVGAQEPMIPLQVKLRAETRNKLTQVAREYGLSLNDVATMALSAGLKKTEDGLREIHHPSDERVAA